MTEAPHHEEQPLDVIDEFLARMNEVAGVHALTLIGLFRLRADLPQLEPPNRTAESSMYIGHGDPNAPTGFAYQRWRFDQLSEQLDTDGPVVRSLGQQWGVMVASQWNDHYRKRLARAKGISVNDVTDAHLADLNRMRNDIIHHLGVGTDRNTGRCEVLKWFAAGEPIHVTPSHIAVFMAHLGMVEHTSEIASAGSWRARLAF